MGTTIENLRDTMGDTWAVYNGIGLGEDVISGVRYIVTSGTGEGCFAYEADDVDAFVDRWSLSDVKPDYADDFCSELTPISDRAFAISMAALHETRVHVGGTCARVLSDAEYSLIRDTVDALALDAESQHETHVRQPDETESERSRG